MSWNEELKEQVDRRYDNLQKLEIDLSQARTNYMVPIAGDFLMVESLTDPTAVPTIKFSNKNDADTIPLKAGRIIKTVFPYIILSNSAQAGESMTLLIGIHLEITDDQPESDSRARACLPVTNASADTSAAADSNVCTGAIIKAHSTNADLVWVDFGTVAVSGSCYDLAPGDAISVPLSNTDQINVLFDAANDKVTIAYDK